MLGALLEMPTPRRNRDTLPFGRRLQALRKRHDMTQEELASRLGISTDGYRHWEHGRSEGLLQRLPTTAAAFGLTIPELLVELGFVPPEDRPNATPMDDMTPAHWRRWLSAEYKPDVAMAVTRLLESADQYTEEEVRWIAENVQRSLDMLRKRPNRDDTPPA